MKKSAFNTLICITTFILLNQVSAENPFLIVMYDEKTEKAIGEFPPKRTIWSDTLKGLSELKAKAVVLKFFFDLPKPEDKVFAEAIGLIPTFLQASIDEVDPSSNQIDTKYSIKADWNKQNIISGTSGWIPERILSERAFDIGFVNFRDINRIPIIEFYDGKYYKTLYYSILKFVYPNLTLNGNTLNNVNKVIELNQNCEMNVSYPEKDNLEYISLIDVLNKKIEKEKIRNKIVIIGWDGKSSEKINISTGSVNKHRVFIYGLYNMYTQLEDKKND